jgi:thiol:disulfide interchange protein
MALTYALLGAAAALSGKVFGQISTSPWAYLLVGNVCIILGLSVFNVFELTIPQFLRGRRLPTQKKGLWPSFLVGLSSGLILGPCTAPVLAALLAYVGARAKVVFGITLLFSFALGMGMLLLVIGTFAGIVGHLPKAGPWLARIEKFLGWGLIFIGEYFIFMAGKLAV